MKIPLFPLLMLASGMFSRTLPAQNPRIVGGGPAPAGAYPWIAALLHREDFSVYDAQFCGGALIHPYWILTAAHCVDGERAAGLQVVVGARDLDAFDLNRVNVLEVIMHPGYNAETNDNDVALLLLAEPVAGVEPLQIIDDPALVQTDVLATVMGWGREFSGQSDPPAILQHVSIPIADQVIVNQDLFGALTDNMLAAGGIGLDSCQGDSGGPLVIRGRQGQWVAAGIVSWGWGCGVARQPGIYTRVSRMRPWIQSHVWPNFAAWEAAAGITANDGPDVDGDGLTQWTEYALRTNPLVADAAQGAPRAGLTEVNGRRSPTLSVRRPLDGGDIRWGLQSSPDLKAWSPLPAAEHLTGSPVAVPGDPGAEEITWRGPEGSAQSFLRAVIQPSRAYTPYHLLSWPGAAAHTLHILDTLNAGYYARNYALSGLPAGESATLTLRSDFFNPVLTLLNAETGAVIQSSSQNNAGGNDEKISFTPAEGLRYAALVTTQAAGTAGEFTLALFKPVTGLPAITGSQTLTGSLDISDPFDLTFADGGHYADDFLFTSTTGAAITVYVNATGFFDPAVAVINTETGGSRLNGRGSWGVGLAMQSFVPRPGVPFLFRATSNAAGLTGGYTLRASATPQLTGGQSRNGSLSTTDGLHPGTAPALHYADDFVLTGLTPGVSRTVIVSSTAFDNTLELIDAFTGNTLDEDDDPYETLGDSYLTFTPAAGRAYLIRVSSYHEKDTGAYTVKAL